MTITEQVQSILKHIPATRNSDKELQLTFLQKAGMNLSPQQIALFRKLPSMETLRRRRQAIQERGLYPADKAVTEQRYRDFQAIRGGDIQVEVDKAVRFRDKPEVATADEMQVINTEVFPT